MFQFVEEGKKIKNTKRDILTLIAKEGGKDVFYYASKLPNHNVHSLRNNLYKYEKQHLIVKRFRAMFGRRLLYPIYYISKKGIKYLESLEKTEAK